MCRIVAEVIAQWSMDPLISYDVLFDEDDDEMEQQQHDEMVPHQEGEPQPLAVSQKIKAIVQKLHVNRGHASPEQMLRLAKRRKSSAEMQTAIKQFKCPVCEELEVPQSRRQATMPHAENPNDIVGKDYVQVELKRGDDQGVMRAIKHNVLTCVCLATGFAQQIICPTGHSMAEAFHNVWAQPYGLPNTVYMVPAMADVSSDFQTYLAQGDIKLVLAAAESHWQSWVAVVRS